MSINSVTISGRLTRNIDLKATKAGSSVLEFSVVVEERKKDQSGEWVSVPNYFNCVIFGNRADSLSRILEKGMKVAISGKLRQESWEKDGQKRSSVSIIADSVEIMSRQNGVENENPPSMDSYTQNTQTAPQNQSGGSVEAYGLSFYEDPIPF